MSASDSSQWNIARTLRRASWFTVVLLLIEFLDELVYGAREAAWPLIRSDLNLTYTQIGILLGIPNVIASFIEPAIGLLGDVWKRRVLVVGGGLIFTLQLVVISLAPSFPVLLLAFILLAPASGAFVSLSQASLMDLDPARHERLMARWTLAGSVGVVAGPLALGAAALLGVSWRGVFLLFAGLAFALTLLAWCQPFKNGHVPGQQSTLRAAFANALRAARRREVWRWLILLEFSDFMLDILLGFLALYMVDVAGVTPALAGTAVAVWTGLGLLGDALFIPLLERVRGLAYLRYSAAVMLFLFPAFLLVPWFWAKLILLALMGLFNAGWYAILQGQLYSTMPGQSGTVMAIGSAFGILVSAVPALLGLIAQRFGLPVTMWLLLLGPVALLVGLPRLKTTAEK